MVASCVAYSASASCAVTVASAMDAVTVPPIAFSASVTPTAIAAPDPLVAPATDSAAPTASAVICAVSLAVRVTEPASASTGFASGALTMNAAIELVMLLLASEPAPDRARPFLPPAPEAAPPMVQASMLPVASAVSVTSPAADTPLPSM